MFPTWHLPGFASAALRKGNFNSQDLASSAELTGDNSTRKQPFFPASSHSSYFGTSYTQALNLKVPNDSLLMKWPHSPRRGNKLRPDFQQQPMASSSSADAAPLSYHVSCVCVCPWLWNDLSLELSDLAERKCKQK